jgi:hypothetical protein
VSPVPGPHLVVVAGPDALPDPGAALEVLDAALDARGATGDLVLTASPAEVRATLAQVAGDGRECVVVPGAATDPGPDVPPGATVVRLDLADRPADRSPAVRRHVRGRGVEGLRYAVDAWWVHRTHPPSLVHRYGPDPDQRADLRLPAAPGAAVPVAVLVHGG